MKIEVVKNSTLDPCSPDKYWRVTWVDDDGDWRAKIFPASDPRLQRYLEAVEEMKIQLGVYMEDKPEC